MNTLEKIELDGVAVLEKVKRQEPLSNNEKEILKIYRTLHAKKAGNAGKRTVKKHNKNW